MTWAHLQNKDSKKQNLAFILCKVCTSMIGSATAQLVQFFV